MCGIAGLMDLKGDRSFDPRLLERMTSSLRHRGPDGDGFHLDRGIALGHRRLAIIDLAGGSQPMHSTDGNISVSFNGEIYNFRSLREELSARGERFQTVSDTEVLINGWRVWNVGLVERLRGMFAFALWDRRQTTLLLARDRLGEKPLHYALLADGTLAFASEIKALLEIETLGRELDPQAIEDFFALGYVPDPKTIYKSIRKLAPAFTLVARRGCEPQVSRYWDLRHEAALSPNTATPFELVRRLTEAVHSQMVADVELGAFLSGGVDSSAVVALMAQQAPDRIQTFSIGFREKEFDESSYAAQVAERYQTRHRSQYVSARSLSLVDRLPVIFDEPFGDSSAIPTFHVCEHASREVKVCLSGDGGDETLAGYRRYRFFLGQQAIRSSLPSRMRSTIFGLAAYAYPKLDRAPSWLRAKTTFAELAVDEAQAFYLMNCAMPDAAREQLYSGDFSVALGGYRGAEVIREKFRASEAETPLQRAQYTDIMTYLPGDILVKVDRTSMANSLEVRPPFLDPAFVAWSYAIPTEAKLRNGQGKALLKEAMTQFLPRDLLYRTKRGFSMPVADWLRGDLRYEVEGLGHDASLMDSGLFNRALIQRLSAEHLSGMRDHSRPLWLLFVFSRFIRHTASYGTRAKAVALA